MEPAFSCPACGGKHFGRDIGDSPTVKCHDQLKIGCEWHGAWPKKFTVNIVPSDEGGYTATIPEIPGCVSEGESLYETILNVAEAADLLLCPRDKDDSADAEQSHRRDVLGNRVVRLIRLEAMKAPEEFLIRESQMISESIADICRHRSATE